MQIRAAFVAVPYPGDAFLLGSREGTEPIDSIAPFIGVTDWATLDAAVLDAHAEALSFLSDGGFRFFLPAFLIADVRGALETADPVFHLTHGFRDSSVTIPVGEREFTKSLGKSALLNPRRYGAMTFHDYALSRLSVFAREEAGAIVAYLEHRLRDRNAEDPDIAAALARFWHGRAAHAPTQRDLADHLAAEDEYLRALQGEPRPDET